MGNASDMFGITLDQESRVFAIDDTGMPVRRQGMPQLTRPTLIMINGFDFDPTETGEDNPHQTLFKDLWRPELRKLPQVSGKMWDVFGFGWYSAELEASSWGGAWLHGRYNPYRWGWDLAWRASGMLAKLIGWDQKLRENRDSVERELPEVYLLAHSLGTRVALNALLQLQPRRVARVVLLNGAEYSQTAKVVAEHTEAEVLNIRVQTDDVLDVLGENFAPEKFMSNVVGRDGIEDPPGNWTDIQLDDMQAARFGKQAFGWDLVGDEPRRYADHWYSYQHRPNWDLLRAFLSGQLTGPQIHAGLTTGIASIG